MPAYSKCRIRLFIFTLFSILLAACQTTTPTLVVDPLTRTAVLTQTPDLVVISTVAPGPKATSTPGITRVPTDTPDEVDLNCCADYRIGLLGEPVTLNYWRYFGEGQDLWSAIVLAGEAPSLYAYPAWSSPERLDFVPALAADLPTAAEERDGLWVVRVQLLESAAWSDGEAITADDIVFTIQTVFSLQLGGGWVDYYDAGFLADVEALDVQTVEFSFYEEPGLGQWQFGAAMGPILPRHFWEPYVEEALALLEGVDPPGTCQGDLSLAQLSTCQAYASARQVLYEIEPSEAPSGGGYSTLGQISNTIQRIPNPDFYGTGLKISQYADGTWERIFPDGIRQQFYGEGEGQPVLNYQRGPFSPLVKFTLYQARIIAYDALSKGRVDLVLDTKSLTDDWLRQATRSEDIDAYHSPQNRLAYLAFNLRRPPFDSPEFRQALEALIDQDEIAREDLEDWVSPAYSLIPPANTFWHNPDLSPPDSSSQKERLESAVEILREAGWSWRSDPAWDAAARQVISGEELRTPDGKPVREISLIYPHPGEDLLMAAFGEEIADLLLVLGVTLVPENLPRAAIVNRALIAGGSFDLYLLDWRLPLFPEFLCQLFSSQNDTLLTGGLNTTGYDNLAFDSLCDDFLLENDPRLAQQQVAQMQALLAEDRPYIPLYYPQVTDMARQNLVLPYLPALNGLVGHGGLQTDMRVLIE